MEEGVPGGEVFRKTSVEDVYSVTPGACVRLKVREGVGK